MDNKFACFTIAYIVILINLTNSLEDFVISCPAPSPCSCYGNVILCSSKNLSHVPSFTKQIAKYPWELHLSDNNIIEIPNHAFINVPLYSLYIPNNGLTRVASDAFAGSEHTLNSVSLGNNNLSQLPEALGKLKNITMLKIQNNPMTVFPKSIFIDISSTLQFLDVGSEEMTSWPTSVGSLHSLTSLTVYNIPFAELPLDAFSGLEHCLILLEFRSTMFKTVPKGINKLHTLQGIAFNDNGQLTTQGFSADVFGNMPKFMDIIIVNSSIPTMPDFSKVVNLRSITVLNCGLSEWDDNTLANPTTLSSVGLNDTSFTTFPTIISRITNLQVLSISNSKFREVPSGAFQKLQKLQHLELDSTPISNISENAFDGNPELQQIILDKTALTEIPRAIQRLSSLHYLNMWNDDIDCTCDTMGWLKHWKGSASMLASGNCKNLNGTDLFTYITKFVPKCPNM